MYFVFCLFNKNVIKIFGDVNERLIFKNEMLNMLNIKFFWFCFFVVVFDCYYFFFSIE